MFHRLKPLRQKGSAPIVETDEPARIPVGILIDGKATVVECTSHEMASSLQCAALAVQGDLTLIEFGQWVEQWYSKPFQVGDRTITMFESLAVLQVAAEERRQQAIEDAIFNQASVIEEYAAALNGDELFWMTVATTQNVFSFSDFEPFHEE